VQIRLLGGFVVERDGQPVEARVWRLRKARTLVKLLALAGDQRLHRDVLLDALWPDRDTTSAVNNCSNIGTSIVPECTISSARLHTKPASSAAGLMM